MSEEKNLVTKLWDRLNPFQPTAKVVTMRHEAIFSQKDESNRLAEVLSASEPSWSVIEEKETGTPTPFMENARPSIGTAVQENAEVSPLRRKHSVLSKRAVRLRPAPLSGDSFQLLQKWEGTVLDVYDGTICARLKDLTHDNPAEEVEIEIEEVLPDDKVLVQTGAAFYWSIGYLHTSFGQRIRASEIRFRRIPGWTESEIEAASKQAAIDATFYNLDCGENAA